MVRLILLAHLALTSVELAASHGFIAKPMARNAMACDKLYPQPPGSFNNDNFICKTDRETGNAVGKPGTPCCHYPHDMAGYHPGDGIPHEPQCGAGHDTRVSDDANKAFTTPGVVQGTYQAGQVMEITWQIAANHAGAYSYRIW